MKIFFSINLFAAVLSLLSGCKSDSNSDVPSLFLPVSADNAVLCEASLSYNHVTLLPLLDSLISMNVNAVCIPPPNASNKSAFKSFMDSCHQRGLTVLIHATQLNDANVELIKSYDVDGFHFLNTGNVATDADWTAKLDALYKTKGLLIIADSILPTLYDVGFGAFKSNVFENALVEAVVGGKSLSLLDSALTYERKSVPKEMRLLRTNPRLTNPADSTNIKMREAMLLATYSLPGLPVNAIEMTQTHDEFLKKLNAFYVNSPAMQYGSIESIERASEGVYVMIRVHEEERILIAINLRNKTQAYKWPPNLSRSNTELMMGEQLTMSGGQELPPFGYQILRFKYLEGMQPLDMDYK